MENGASNDGGEESTASNLMSIPVELRLNIYSYLIKARWDKTLIFENRTYRCISHRQQALAKLSRTSKQLHEDVKEPLHDGQIQLEILDDDGFAYCSVHEWRRRLRRHSAGNLRGRDRQSVGERYSG